MAPFGLDPRGGVAMNTHGLASAAVDCSSDTGENRAARTQRPLRGCMVVDRPAVATADYADPPSSDFTLMSTFFRLIELRRRM